MSVVIVLTCEITTDVDFLSACSAKLKRDLSHGFKKRAWRFTRARLCSRGPVEPLALQHSSGD